MHRFLEARLEEPSLPVPRVLRPQGGQSQCTPSLFFDSLHNKHRCFSALTTHITYHNRGRDLHSPGGGPCVPSRSALGGRNALHQVRKQAVQAVVSEGRQQARDSGHSPFRGPARRRSPRPRISKFAPLQHAGRQPTVNSLSSERQLRAGFNRSRRVTLRRSRHGSRPR